MKYRLGAGAAMFRSPPRAVPLKTFCPVECSTCNMQAEAPTTQAGRTLKPITETGRTLKPADGYLLILNNLLTYRYVSVRYKFSFSICSLIAKKSKRSFNQ